MSKLIKYFLCGAAIVLSVAIIIALVYLRFVYRAIRDNQADNFPPALVRLIDRLSGQPAAESKPKLKLEETIQIIEGWTSQDIAQYLSGFGKWSEAKFFAAAGQPQTDYRSHPELSALPDWSAKFSFLNDKPKYYGLEGYLFPDTYRVYASSTEKEIIEKMLTNFDSKLTPKLRADIKAQGKTIYNIIIMASLVEKEAPLNYQTGDNRDARLIAGIFWRRLKNGQGLESDASLSYILGDKNPRHAGSELELDSPYNTYKHRGLPPGPICNPGLLAIEAAIYPLATDYNYFLTPQGKNTVIYAKTYEEHLQNKYHYLK